MHRADEGDFVSLTAKHNFSMAHLGMALGMLRNSLEELQVQRCNDFFAVGSGTLSAVACLPRLRVLRIEDLHCRADRDTLAELAQLRGVRALSARGACLCAECRGGPAVKGFGINTFYWLLWNDMDCWSLHALDAASVMKRSDRCTGSCERVPGKGCMGTT